MPQCILPFSKMSFARPTMLDSGAVATFWVFAFVRQVMKDKTQAVDSCPLFVIGFNDDPGSIFSIGVKEHFFFSVCVLIPFTM